MPLFRVLKTMTDYSECYVEAESEDAAIEKVMAHGGDPFGKEWCGDSSLSAEPATESDVEYETVIGRD